MKTFLFLCIIFSCSISFSQSASFPVKFFEMLKSEKQKIEQNIEVSLDADSTGNDLMYLVGTKKPVKGKLVEVGTKTISFVDNTGVNFTLSKKEVRYIKTADGRTHSFNVDEDEDYTSSETTDKDSGGVSGWGVVGIVLTVLLILGIVSALVR